MKKLFHRTGTKGLFSFINTSGAAVKFLTKAINGGILAV